MKNKQQTIAVTLLSKLPKETLTKLVEGYVTYAAKVRYVYYAIGCFLMLITGYNLMFGGKRFPIEQAKTIENTLITIIIIFLVFFIGYGIYIIGKLRRLKKEINTVADKHMMHRKDLRKEFHVFVKATIGGIGLR